MLQVSLFLSLVAAISLQAQAAQAEPLEYKSWKVFESDYGYEFKHPDCWDMHLQGISEEGPFHLAPEVYISEKSCETKRRDPEIPNVMSFDASGKKFDETTRKQRIAQLEKSISGNLKAKNYLVSKKRDAEGSGKMFFYVEHHDKYQNKIRWKVQLFCPERVVYISGASTKDPDKALLEKFKKGDLALPEPYKTIFDSVKCTRDWK